MNRFNTPIQSSRKYVNQYWTPNADLLAKALQSQQTNYDLAQQAGNIPIEALPKDEELAQSIRSGIDNKITNLANVYKTQGVNAGNREQKNLLRDIRRMQLPGGQVFNLKKNVTNYQEYKKQIDSMYKEGKINKDKKDQLLNMSMNAFSGSYTDDIFNEFNGISAATDVNLSEQAAKLADGWMADKVNSGQYKMLNGQYYDVQSKKYVDYNEVYNSISKQIINDPNNKAFLRQEAQLKGLVGEDATKYISQLVHDAANFAANKESFSEVDSKYLKNWMLEAQIKKKNDQDLIDYEYNLGGGETNTRLYTTDSGMKELDIKEGLVPGGTTEYYSRDEFGVRSSIPTKTQSYKAIPIEEFANTAKALEEYPGLNEIVERFPRKKNGNEVELNKDYNKRVKEIYDMKRESLSKASGVYTQYGDKQKARRKETVIGTGESFGDIVHKTIWVTKPGQPPKQMSLENFMETVGAKNAKEFISRANVLGDVRADNGIVPSGEEGVYSKGDKVYSFIIENISNQDAMHKDVVYQLTAPLKDGKMQNSPQVMIGDEIISTKAVDNFVVDGQGNPIDYNRQLHVIGEDGTDLTISDGIKVEDIIVANNKSNMFSPVNQFTTKAGKSGNTIITTQQKSESENE